MLKLGSGFAGCGAGCSELLGQIGDPYFIGDQPALTQTSGWVDAWASRTSAYAVAAKSAADVAAAVNFARIHNLGWWSRAEGTATSARRTRPIRCWCGRAR